MVSASGCGIRVRRCSKEVRKYIQRGWDSFMHFTHFDVEEFLEFMDSRCTRIVLFSLALFSCIPCTRSGFFVLFYLFIYLFYFHEVLLIELQSS